jgi:hypothetical protein
VPVEESIEEGQVMPHDSEVAIEKGMAVPECERGEELAAPLSSATDSRCSRA